MPDYYMVLNLFKAHKSSGIFAFYKKELKLLTSPINIFSLKSFFFFFFYCEMTSRLKNIYIKGLCSNHSLLVHYKQYKALSFQPSTTYYKQVHPISQLFQSFFYSHNSAIISQTHKISLLYTLCLWPFKFAYEALKREKDRKQASMVVISTYHTGVMEGGV